MSSCREKSLPNVIKMLTRINENDDSCVRNVLHAEARDAKMPFKTRKGCKTQWENKVECDHVKITLRLGIAAVDIILCIYFDLAL